MSYDDTMHTAQANRQKVSQILPLARQASYTLEAAQEKLGKARGWGIVDMLGGGFITNLIKHSILDNAMQEIRRAKPMLRDLSRMLKTLQVDRDIQTNIGDFAIFADFFFDGIFADVYMQSKIRNLQYDLETTLDKLYDVISTLEDFDRYEERVLGGYDR